LYLNRVNFHKFDVFLIFISAKREARYAKREARTLTQRVLIRLIMGHSFLPCPRGMLACKSIPLLVTSCVASAPQQQLEVDV
jgi:hypothetical protein